MATGGDPEDSTFLSVHGTSGSNERGVQHNEIRMNSNLREYIAIQSMNKTLNAKIKSLKQEINEQTKDFSAEKMEMVRNHKRETDALKKNYKKKLESVDSKSREQGEEIKRLKNQIELLERSEKELREKVERAKHDEKHKNDYEKLSREMSASKKEIKILKEQITVLENDVVEKEQQIMTGTEKNVEISDKLDSLAKQHETMEIHLISTREMVQGMSQSLEQFIKMQNGQEIKTSDQRENTLPPIVGPQRLPQNRRKDNWKVWK